MDTAVQETPQNSSCIFCNIVNKIENTELLYEDEDVCVFRDIKPASRYHVLTIPKRHIEDVKALTSADKQLGHTGTFTCLSLPALQKVASAEKKRRKKLSIERMLAVSKELLIKHNLTLDSARFGYHWPPFRSVHHLHLHTIAPEADMGFIARMIFRKDSFWFVSPEYVVSRL